MTNPFSSYGAERVSNRRGDSDFRRLLDEARLVPVSSVFASSVKLVRAGREWKACCPFHSDRTPSLTINDAKGFYHCFGCGAHGDALDAARELQGLSLIDAAEMLAGGSLPSAMPARQFPPSPANDRDTVEDARAIWRGSVPAQGTPAQAYLVSRGLHLPIPPTIRFAKLRYGGRGEPTPCLVALVTSPDNQLSGIQRTYLAADGRGKADIPAAKRSLGRIMGGAIRLGPVASEVVVAEGLEDALSLQQELGAVAWAAGGASMLPGMEFPSSVKSVVIGRDNDSAGERSAHAAARNFSGRGLSVRIMRPSEGFKDFNQELIEGVRS